MRRVCVGFIVDIKDEEKNKKYQNRLFGRSSRKNILFTLLFGEKMSEVGSFQNNSLPTRLRAKAL